MLGRGKTKKPKSETGSGYDSDPEAFPDWEPTKANEVAMRHVKFTMGQLKTDDPHTWIYRRPTRVAEKKAHGKADGYLDEDPKEHFVIADTARKRYKKNIEEKEADFDVDYRTIQIYFSNIFHPLEFGQGEILPDYRTKTDVDDNVKK